MLVEVRDRVAPCKRGIFGCTEGLYTTRQDTAYRG